MIQFVDFLDISNSIYALILLIVGTIGNLFGAGICLKQELRKTPTFIFCFYILLSDAISMYFWNIDTMIFAFLKLWLEGLNVITCQIMTLFQCTTHNWVAWLLVLMSIEKFLSIKSHKWSQKFNSKKATIVSLVAGSILFIFHLGFAINLHQLNLRNETNCLVTEEFNTWYRSNLYVYFTIPFFLICTSNCLLIREIVKHESKTKVKAINVEQNNKSKNATISVLWITSTFLFLTLPNILCIYFNDYFQSIPYGLTIVNVTTNLQFTFHGFNFLIIYLANKKFRYCVNNFKLRRNKISSATGGDAS
jgi:hypothetical protein